jgi:hypothetical protein
MDKLEALEIVWKMLPVDASTVQKEAWQTVKRIVHMPQADNTGRPKCDQCEYFDISKKQYNIECYSCKWYHGDMFTLRASA